MSPQEKGRMLEGNPVNFEFMMSVRAEKPSDE
jgi:hypothetical protein